MEDRLGVTRLPVARQSTFSHGSTFYWYFIQQGDSSFRIKKNKGLIKMFHTFSGQLSDCLNFIFIFGVKIILTTLPDWIVRTSNFKLVTITKIKSQNLGLWQIFLLWREGGESSVWWCLLWEDQYFVNYNHLDHLTDIRALVRRPVWLMEAVPNQWSWLGIWRYFTENISWQDTACNDLKW